jgi:4-amino-4-deoxy-L-arabinose transferase-like glycosyltransferase
MLVSVRAWLREHPALGLAVYATVLASAAFALSRPVLIVNDGHMYFEMARSMRHGTLEFYNGLDVVDSPELWMMHAVQRGPHLYSKYPPLYAVVAVVPYALLGIRGMYLLNAAGFVGTVLACYALARRVLSPSRAILATWLLPLVVPLLPYVLMEVPHLVALALFLWAVVQWDDARQSAEPRAATWKGFAAGLLAGLAFGVRLPDVIVAAPLFVIAFFHARHRARTLGGLSTGFGLCLLAVAAFNVQRFGSPNPFSYGPSDSTFGAPYPEESPSFFLHPALVVDFAIVLCVFVGARWMRRPATAWVLSSPSCHRCARSPCA